MSEVGDTADNVSLVQPEPSSVGRPAAGEDPVKREQILDGALRVFTQMGFDAASMNDITREAGVSKGTLYVYFKNKEHLFAAMIGRQKLRIFAQLQDILQRDMPLAETLHDFGVFFAEHLLSDHTIRGMRALIGVIDRMPALANVYMAVGPNSGPSVLAAYLEREVHAGRLKDIDDALQAGRQFGDLCLGGMFRLRLFGEMVEPPTKEEVEKNVASAIRLFLNTYGV